MHMIPEPRGRRTEVEEEEEKRVLLDVQKMHQQQKYISVKR